MRKIFLYLCCLASLLLTCSCGKRPMTREDIAEAMEIVKKSDRAIYLENTQGMMDCANELLNLSKKFARNDDSDHLRQLAFLRLGDAYSYKNDYRKAIQSYDKILAENPYYEFENYYYEINAFFFGIFQIIEKYLFGIFFFGQIICLENILFRIFAQK